eukprot:g16158.t1
MYAAVASTPCGSYFELHLAVKLAIAFFVEMVSRSPMEGFAEPPKVLGEVFRVDSMADQDGIAIGGWETFETNDTSRARWFHMKLTRQNAPFLYMKGEPFRTISTSELLAVTVAIMVFGPGGRWRSGAGRVSVTGLTDNMSNAFLLDKFLTTRFPASLMLMELAAQLDLYKLDLGLAWIPREQNEAADDLSKEKFDQFDARHRVAVNMEELEFLILRRLLSAATALDSEIKEKQVSKPKEGLYRFLSLTASRPETSSGDSLYAGMPAPDPEKEKVNTRAKDIFADPPAKEDLCRIRQLQPIPHSDLSLVIFLDIDGVLRKLESIPTITVNGGTLPLDLGNRALLPEALRALKYLVHITGAGAETQSQQHHNIIRVAEEFIFAGRGTNCTPSTRNARSRGHSSPAAKGGQRGRFN